MLKQASKTSAVILSLVLSLGSFGISKSVAAQQDCSDKITGTLKALASDADLPLDEFWKAEHLDDFRHKKIGAELDPDAAIFKDPDFVNRALHALNRSAQDDFRKPVNAWYYAQKLVSVLANDPANHARLKPILEKSLILLQNGHQDSPTRAGIYNLLSEFYRSPSFEAERTEIARFAFEKLYRERHDTAAKSIFGTKVSRIQDQELRNAIVREYLKDLGTEERNSLAHFAAANPELNLKWIPMALGVHRRLEALEVATKSVAYWNWQTFGWVKDSKSIGPFKQALQTVAAQTSKIYFDIGPILDDLPRIKSNFSRIRAEGDDAIMAKLAKLAGEKASPIADSGDLSITNVELYWILTHPQFVSKTVFLKDLQPLSPEQISSMIKDLGLPDLRGKAPVVPIPNNY